MTAAGVATAAWQPGALPDGAAVALADIASRLSLPGTAARLSFGAPTPLPWPIDVQYASAPPDAVPGILPVKGVWQPLAELPSPTLPAAQQAGAYRDAAGALHVLTRTGGRIALFAAGRWGDPRFTTAAKPRLASANQGHDRGVCRRRRGRARQDHARHAGTSVRQPDRRERQEARPPAAGLPHRLVAEREAGDDAAGAPARTRSLPIRLRVPAAQWRAAGPHALRIVAVDPYGRKSSLSVAVAR